jgi:hypothetical protein
MNKKSDAAFNEKGDDRLLGVFKSEQDAKSSIQKYLELPGFKDAKEDFLIDKYELNKERWTEGYFTYFY